MAAMETVPARPYPPQIQQLRRSIKDAESVVKNLTAQLITAQNECEQLQNEWLQYQASIAPVRKCPSEVLLMMFQMYLIEDPRLVCNLLLVCKYWYEVVSASPQLWTDIRVNFTSDWDGESVSASTNLYIDTCLQRSGSMMLDLQLDFRQLLTIRDHVIAEIRSILQNFVSEQGQQALVDWTNSLDTEELDNEWHPPIMSTGYLIYAFEVIRKLEGENGSIMTRWRSLELQLPENNNEFAEEVWHQFIYPAPKLTRMVVGRFQHSFPYHSDPTLYPFPGLSALKHLEMQDVPDRQCLTTASSLETIVLKGGVEDWTGTLLSSFTRLTTLELAQGVYGEDARVTRCIISLPELRQLTVRGSFVYLWTIEFIVPKLQFLNIIQNMWNWGDTLPKVQPPCVNWEVGRDWRYGGESPDLKAEFRRILLEYHSAEHLICPRFLKKSVTGCIQELRADGTLPSALKTVSFKSREGFSDITETWRSSEP